MGLQLLRFPGPLGWCGASLAWAEWPDKDGNCEAQGVASWAWRLTDTQAARRPEQGGGCPQASFGEAIIPGPCCTHPHSLLEDRVLAGGGCLGWVGSPGPGTEESGLGWGGVAFLLLHGFFTLSSQAQCWIGQESLVSGLVVIF